MAGVSTPLDADRARRDRPRPAGDETAHRGAGGPAGAGGPGRAVDARRQPDEVAPGPHHLVLRDVRPRPAPARLPARPRRPTATCSTRTTSRSGTATPAPQRGLISRPTCEEVAEYRAAVDRSLDELIDDRRRGDAERPSLPLLELGIHHEQQHQELLLMDIKHVFSCNPLRPAYRLGTTTTSRRRSGAVAAGCDIEPERDHRRSATTAAGFAFDNEGPRHDVLVRPFALADRLVTDGEWLAFIDDGGYERPELWLSEGWATVQSEGWTAPLYWDRDGDGWSVFTLGGTRPVHDVHAGRPRQLLRGRRLRPVGRRPAADRGRVGGGGDVRRRRRRAERPRRRPPAPAAARPAVPDGRPGASCSATCGSGRPAPTSPTPASRRRRAPSASTTASSCAARWCCGAAPASRPPGHTRPTYRNFFPPAARWAFSGLRLARDA